jgi:hypothetical protein
MTVFIVGLIAIGLINFFSGIYAVAVLSSVIKMFSFIIAVLFLMLVGFVIYTAFNKSRGKKNETIGD